jgi:hypothetical protein
MTVAIALAATPPVVLAAAGTVTHSDWLTSTAIPIGVLTSDHRCDPRRRNCPPSSRQRSSTMRPPAGGAATAGP